jgi:hypothetical protein
VCDKPVESAEQLKTEPIERVPAAFARISRPPRFFEHVELMKALYGAFDLICLCNPAHITKDDTQRDD